MGQPHLEIGDVYRSKDGKGSDFARIVEITPRDVTFERFSLRRPKPRFQLPLWFVKSTRCGWKLDRGRHAGGKRDAGRPDFTV